MRSHTSYAGAYERATSTPFGIIETHNLNLFASRRVSDFEASAFRCFCCSYVSLESSLSLLSSLLIRSLWFGPKISVATVDSGAGISHETTDLIMSRAAKAKGIHNLRAYVDSLPSRKCSTQNDKSVSHRRHSLLLENNYLRAPSAMSSGISIFCKHFWRRHAHQHHHHHYLMRSTAHTSSRIRNLKSN